MQSRQRTWLDTMTKMKISSCREIKEAWTFQLSGLAEIQHNYFKTIRPNPNRLVRCSWWWCCHVLHFDSTVHRSKRIEASFKALQPNICVVRRRCFELCSSRSFGVLNCDKCGVAWPLDCHLHCIHLIRFVPTFYTPRKSCLIFTLSLRFAHSRQLETLPIRPSLTGKAATTRIHLRTVRCHLW